MFPTRSLARPRLAASGLVVVLGLLLASVQVAPAAAQQPPTGEAPGAPGRPTYFTDADKQGFGTAVTRESNVWFTLSGGALTDVYYPRLDVPSVRDLRFVVTDGRSFAELDAEATRHQTVLLDDRALLYQQINTARSGRYRLTKTYVADPERSVVVVDVELESLDGGDYRLYALLDPALDNGHEGDVGHSGHGAVTAVDGRVASALVAEPGLGRTSSGFAGASDGWADLRGDFRMDWTYRRAAGGNLVQTAELAPGGRHRLALGFADTAEGALQAARSSLKEPFDSLADRYKQGWHDYLDGLRPAPESVEGLEATYNVSVMVLKASEDKLFPGAFVAAPAMPWRWDEIEQPSGPYHLVWPRDQYQIATALDAVGDRAAARRALRWLFDRAQEPDGSFPQNAQVDGRERWTELQLDQVAFPLVMAWQLGVTDRETWQRHVRPAAEFLAARGPITGQERWEEEKGYSPSTIAAEIAGLVCAAEIARANGDTTAADRYLRLADHWQQHVDDWTFTRTGPLGDGRYYERIDQMGRPDDAAPLEINNGVGNVPERAVVDAGFLELVRLGVRPADDPTVLASLPEVDATLRRETPHGPYWYRYTRDAYGEKADGGDWDLDPGGIGRLWPILTGERGEYELAAGRDAAAHLETMAAAGNQGHLISEQVWDRTEPTRFGFQMGEGTHAATPLTWSHAQLVRLAHSIDAGHPVEQPTVVACRYTGNCKP